jgi:ATP/maltotriose-dependent transcriptional regulator MalT
MPLDQAQKCLTPRRSAVLGLLHQGLSSKLIARQLFISENTARKHVQDILEIFRWRAALKRSLRCATRGWLGEGGQLRG